MKVFTAFLEQHRITFGELLIADSYSSSTTMALIPSAPSQNGTEYADKVSKPGRANTSVLCLYQAESSAQGVNQAISRQAWRWLQVSLSRRFLAFLLAVLGTASAGFLVLFLYIYSQALGHEREQASRALSLLLQVSLENAMLKRDLAGLQGIVERLGAQEGILDVLILNPEGEIRFAADPARIGEQAASLFEQACANCSATQIPSQPSTQFLTDANGQDILRTLQPVANRAICTNCHGPTDINPINGVLAVDYDAKPIQNKALRSLGGMILAGLVMLCIATWAAWWFMRRFVLRPVAALDQASSALSTDNLESRVAISGNDEMARLGRTFNDMAQRLQQQHRELRKQEKFLQDIIDAIPDGIRVIDNEYRIIKANRAYCQQIGRGLTEVLQQHCYSSSHQQSAPCAPTLVTCPLHEIRAGKKTLKCIQQFRSSSGKELPVEIFAAAMSVESDKYPGPIVVEAIRDLSAQIEFSHEQKLAGLGELAAGVAHEIRNPLASVRIALQASMRALDQESSDTDELTDYLSVVDRQLDNCLDVTDRLLKLSTFSSRHPELVEINQAIIDTLSLLRYESEQQQVAIQLKLAPGVLRVVANDSDVRMIVLNLAQNAFHAMAQGGVLTVTSAVNGPDVELVFEDTGQGIPPDIMPRIFDPFFSARADGKKGTGLGLPIVKSLLERHKGRIEVSSSSAGGAVFRVSFPNPE